ncbi:glycosyltransferase [Pedobacter sp. Du54]|uniref:glycosyltransferase n=1 Tax=Pedobacter anseongensis TaxID=3133439 RepID=UPI0030A9BF5A
MLTNTTPKVSIIIPTYRDWDRLNLCLECLKNQSLSLDNFEVIIINNDSSDGFELTDIPNNFKLIVEPKAGSYAARNAALSIARGEIVGFTDSDCLPDRNWIQNALFYFEEKNAERVAGKVKIFPKEVGNETWPELYESFFAFNQKRNVDKLKGAITANFFTKKLFFDTVGLFNSDLKSGEDFGWNRRANNFDISLTYADDVVVKHPARSKYSELAKKKRRVFGGQKKFDFKNIKGFVKEITYIPTLFVLTFIIPTYRLFRESNLGFWSQVKVVYVIFYLFLILLKEYFKLLFGGERER